MNTKTQELVKSGTGFWTRGLFAIILFAVSFWIFYALESTHKIDVEIQLAAEYQDILTMYWPDSAGNFSERRSDSQKYPSGEKTIQLQIETFNAKQYLRIDPGKRANSITIQSMSFERFGNVVQIPLHSIKKRIMSTVATDVENSVDGLFLEFRTEDPQVFLRNMPRPGMNPFQWSLLISIVLTIPFLTSTSVKNQLPKKLIQPLFLSIALCLLGWRYNWNFYILALLSTGLSISLTTSVYKLRATETKNRRHIVSAISISFVFGCCLFIPFITLISSDSKYLKKATELVREAVVNNERGELHSVVKKLAKDLEGNLKYHFPSRVDLVDLNAKIKIFGLGYSPTSKAIVGQDGYFFEGYGLRRVEGDTVASFDNVTDYMGLIPFTEQELEEWRICLEERYYWLKELGAKYVFTVAPSKATIYPEKLPKKIYDTKERINRPTRYSQLINYLQKQSIVPVIDLKQPLIKAKKRMADAEKNLPLYYKTDFHWTYLGAFVAYREIVENINRLYPKLGLKAQNINNFRVHERKDWVHFSFIYSLGLKPVEHKYETYLTFFPNQGTRLATSLDWLNKGINDYSLPENRSELCGGEAITIRSIASAGGMRELQRLFVIGDSFAEKYVAYFSAHAEKTYNFRAVFQFNPSVFQKFKPDLVIQEMLNMYLLNSPPTNPAEIKEARIRALKKTI